MSSLVPFSGAIGRATVALASVTNENSVSLANLNFDFSIVKLEAPHEFSGIGSTISEKRKHNAEHGPLHKTARKLGALFHGLLPNTPQLFRAYGKRVSEISSSHSANPKATVRDGIFASQIGADSTSIWAAATSGDGAIGVHLLACMLARILTDAEATSVWEELVIKRKIQIEKECNESMYKSQFDAAILAAQQDITRSELATWDNSARSWLRTGDQVKVLQHKQLMLMLDTISMPINNDKELYASVTNAWISALTTMNNLVNGTPQKVQSGAILLGLSAWHLYPDISILSGSSNVILQRDPLIAPLGVLTISHEICDSDKKVTWSLPLAYMKYYGEPQNFCRTLGQDNTRISMDQFGFVVLGCVFATWKNYARTPQIGMGYMLDVVNAWRGLHLGSGDDNLSRSVSSTSSCVSTLFKAAEAFEVATQDEQDFALKLVRLGIQRNQFLCALTQHPPPVFGLSEFSTVFPMMKSEEERINCLRQIGEFLPLEADIYVIRYQVLQPNWAPMYEYATLTPLAKQTSKRTRDGSVKVSTSLGGQHVRWFPIVTSVCNAREHQPEQKKCSHCYKSSKHRRANDIENDTNLARICHDLDTFDYDKCSSYSSTFEARRIELEASGQICMPVHQYLYDDSPEEYDGFGIGSSGGNIPGREPKSLFDFGIGSSFKTALRTLVQNNSDHLKQSSASCELQYHSGDLATAAIFRLEANPWRKSSRQGARVPPSMSSSNPIGNYIIPDCFKVVMDPKNFRASALVQWLRGLCAGSSTTFVENDTSEVNIMNKAAKIRGNGYPTYTKALKAVASAADIYKLLPDATVSTLIVQSQTLDKALWIPQHDSRFLSLRLSRAEAFACIASFESGTCNISPASLGEVFAMSCGNSIFVAGPLLCDPFEVPTNTEIRRVIGNVGRPGISLLIAPPVPRVVTPPADNWLQINNRPFRGTIEDCFKDTSIHISFTAYELPLDSVNNIQGRSNVIDRPASLVETLVSVYDKEVWIADLNVLQSLQSSLLRRFECGGPGIGGKVPNCIHGVARKSHATYAEVIEYDGHTSVTVENWWELLQTHDKIPKVVNSHNNWLARLAFVSVCVQNGWATILLPSDDICWACCKKYISGSDDWNSRNAQTVLIT